MKVKPKEILVNLPMVLLFQDPMEASVLASAINTIIHGKVKVKFEEIGILGGQSANIFYIQRNDEYTEIRSEFRQMIEREEMHENDLEMHDGDWTDPNPYFDQD